MNLRKLLLLFCMSILLLSTGCSTAKETVEIETLDQLDNESYTICAATGSAAEFFAMERFHHAKLKSFSELDEMVVAMEYGQVDAIVFSETALLTLMNEKPGEFRFLEEPVGMSDVCMAVSPKTTLPDLLSDLNAFLAAKEKEGYLENLYERWNDPNCRMPDIPDAENPKATLRVGTQGNIAPLSFYQNGELAGINIELVHQFAYEYNYAIEYRVEALSSQLNDAEFGGIDLIDGGLLYTDERAKIVTFPDTPITRVPIRAMLMNTGSPEYKASHNSIINSFENAVLKEGRWKMILRGLLVTIILSVGSLLLGTLLTFAFCFLYRSKIKPVALLMKAFITVISGTPIVLTLMICFYIVFRGVGLSEIIVSIIAFSIDLGARGALTLDSGLRSVHAGEIEAAEAMGLTPAQIFWHIQLPQAISNSFGVYETQIVAMVKSTSVVGYISLQDLAKVSDIIRSRTFETFFSLVLTALIYFILARIIVFLLDRAGRILDPKRRKHA